MKTETQNLAALVRLALQKRTFIPVCHTEITNALHALQTASELLPFATQHIVDAVSDLRQAVHVLSGLIYTTSNGTITLNSNHRKALLNHACRLHKKLCTYLNGYSDAQVTQPGIYSVKSLLKILTRVNETFKENILLVKLYPLVQPVIEKVLATKTLSFHQWVWWSQFVAVCNTPVNSAEILEDFLIKLNFNASAFINFLSANISGEMRSVLTTGEKSQLLIDQLVKYKSVNCFSGGCYPAESSVKKAMISFLKTQLIFLSGHTSAQIVGETKPPKLHTALSVPQLALFIRLMAETKILNETNQSALLKNIAAFVSTSKAASLSSESLRINYYTPNTATKNIVKEYLLQMVRLSNTY